jgi:Do/DeqQ family serine protease
MNLIVDLAMKRIIQVLVIVSLSVMTIWGVKSIFSDKNEGIVTGTSFSGSQQAEVISAGFLPVAPFSGPDFTTAAEKTVHGVVHIKSEFTGRTGGYDEFFAPFLDFFGNPYHGNNTYTGFGSGVIITNDGYIVTNNHVVDGAGNINVTLNDHREFEAALIGTDPTTDLALLKIESENTPFITFGNSDGVRIGEWVLAVGNPFNLTSTVTAGIVSAKARNINILGTPGAIESFIQTDAAVNMGNSGGALVNMNGELIGVNAAIASNTGSYAGYSFAIPVNIVKKVVNDLLDFGQVQRAYLGVTIREVDSKLVKEKDLDVANGVFIESVSETGGANTAGIQAGDVIVSVDNHQIRTNAELLEIIGQHNPGDLVQVMIHRDGEEKNFGVELRNQAGSTEIEKKGDDFFISDLGATLEEVPAEDKDNLNLSAGLKVVELQDGMLKKGGVQKGFIILKINGVNISSRQDIDYALKNVRSGVIRIEGVYPNGMRMNYGFIL